MQHHWPFLIFSNVALAYLRSQQTFALDMNFANEGGKMLRNRLKFVSLLCP